MIIWELGVDFEAEDIEDGFTILDETIVDYWDDGSEQ